VSLSENLGRPYIDYEGNDQRFFRESALPAEELECLMSLDVFADGFQAATSAPSARATRRNLV